MDSEEYREFIKKMVESPELRLKDDGCDIDALVEDMKQSGFNPTITTSLNPEDYLDLTRSDVYA